VTAKLKTAWENKPFFGALLRSAVLRSGGFFIFVFILLLCQNFRYTLSGIFLPEISSNFLDFLFDRFYK